MAYEKPELYELASALSIVLDIPPGSGDSVDPAGRASEGLALGLDD